MRRILSTILVLISMICIFSACDSNDYVADVGRLKISKQEYLKALETRYSKKENYQDLANDKKMEILNTLIEKTQKLNDAYDRDLDQDSIIVSETRKYRDKLLVSRYYERHIIDQIISADDLNTYIENQRTEVNASQILITHSGTVPENIRTPDEAKQLIEELLKKINSGGSIDSLAVLYSEDPTAKQSKGNLGWFSWGVMVPEFQEAVWQMNVGSIVGPIETKYGYHIIKLNDRRENAKYSEPKTVEDFYYIKRKMMQAYGDSARVLWGEYTGKLSETFNLTVSKLAVMSLSAAITEKVNAGHVNLQSFSDEEQNIPLAKWDGGSLSLKGVIDRNINRVSQALLTYRQVSVLETDVKNMAIIEIAIQDAIDEGLANDSFIKDQVAKFRDDKLVQKIEDVVLVRNMEISDEDARQYYDENPDKFIKPAEIELWEIYVKDKKLADEIVVKLNRGTRFGLLAEKIFRR